MFRSFHQQTTGRQTAGQTGQLRALDRTSRVCDFVIQYLFRKKKLRIILH